MRIKSFLFTLLFILLFASTAVIFFLFTLQNKKFNQIIQNLREQSTIKEEVQEPQIIEKIISQSQLWRPIQEKAQDTVVQIFSQIAEIDLLHPYKSPHQSSAYGSGFFISENGDLITNFHVVDQAKAIWIQIPSLGKRIIDVEIVGVSPERDLALLRITPEGKEIITKALGKIPFLSLGDSDKVRRSDEVIALGYPLGQQSLKSTTGVISGHERFYLQISAAVNPGNSGGPLLNNKGEVVGIINANIPAAQNVGYAIPVNTLNVILPDLYKVPLLRKPFLGILFNNATDALTDFLGNPQPGGCYVSKTIQGSTLEKAGIQQGDMIYEINGIRIDQYGEMSVPWSEDKISLVDYVSRLAIDDTITLTIYRKGVKKEIKVTYAYPAPQAIHKIYPGYEPIDYEIFAGMVIMELTLNHIPLLVNPTSPSIPPASGLTKYSEINNQKNPSLIITHVFSTSQLYRSRTINAGSTINEINGTPVRTLAQLRKAIKEGSRNTFLTIRASDNYLRIDNVFVALAWDKIIEEEQRLAADYKYTITDTVKDILTLRKADKQLACAATPQKVITCTN